MMRVLGVHFSTDKRRRVNVVRPSLIRGEEEEDDGGDECDGRGQKKTDEGREGGKRSMSHAEQRANLRCTSPLPLLLLTLLINNAKKIHWEDGGDCATNAQ